MFSSVQLVVLSSISNAMVGYPCDAVVGCDERESCIGIEFCYFGETPGTGGCTGVDEATSDFTGVNGDITKKQHSGLCFNTYELYAELDAGIVQGYGNGHLNPCNFENNKICNPYFPGKANLSCYEGFCQIVCNGNVSDCSYSITLGKGVCGNVAYCDLNDKETCEVVDPKKNYKYYTVYSPSDTGSCGYESESTCDNIFRFCREGEWCNIDVNDHLGTCEPDGPDFPNLENYEEHHSENGDNKQDSDGSIASFVSCAVVLALAALL